MRFARPLGFSFVALLVIGCSLAIGLTSHNNQQTNSIKAYIALTKLVSANQADKTLDQRRKFDELYQLLSSDNRERLRNQLIQFSSQRDISSSFKLYPTRLLVDLAQHGHVNAMRFLARSNLADANQWHTELLSIDYLHTWQYASILADTQGADKQLTQKMYLTALTFLENELELESQAKSQQLEALIDELVKHAITHKVEQWQTLLMKYSTPRISHWRNLYQQYYVENLRELDSPSVNNPANKCDKPLTLLANTPWDLIQLSQVTKQFLQAELSEGFCIRRLVWSADIQQIEHNLTNSSQPYWLVMRQVNKAYRFKQQIHVPPTASLKLLQHEIAHWLGFEDEYALRAETANIRCTRVNSRQNIWAMGHNIVAIKDGTRFNSVADAYQALAPHMKWIEHISDMKSFLTLGEKGWEIKPVTEHFEHIGIYPADTCNNFYGVTAYKPLLNLSFMYNYELSIPKFYKELLIDDG
ncbi:hypothetical protein ACMZOO_14295 [Catenovulum sp. SX2]|uniref:hypothetical protein n=1 Tax=Catenovulum sp. SX2 TaxID=3398614 RepID=UPI003F868E9F